MVLDAKAFAHLATLVKDHRSNWLCVTSENGELRKQSYILNGKTGKVVASVEQLQANVSSATGD